MNDYETISINGDGRNILKQEELSLLEKISIFFMGLFLYIFNVDLRFYP